MREKEERRERRREKEKWRLGKCKRLKEAETGEREKSLLRKKYKKKDKGVFLRNLRRVEKGKSVELLSKQEKW